MGEEDVDDPPQLRFRDSMKLFCCKEGDAVDIRLLSCRIVLALTLTRGRVVNAISLEFLQAVAATVK